jgi:hypothetical protein
MANKVVLLAVAAGLIPAGAAPAAEARPRTTTPGVLYIIKVVLTDKTISIPRDKYTRNGHSRYPRGATIRYSLLNLGSRPYSFEIWGAHTDPIRPRGRDSILVYWNFRGKFGYRLLFKGRPAGPRGFVEIF